MVKGFPSKVLFVSYFILILSVGFLGFILASGRKKRQICFLNLCRQAADEKVSCSNLWCKRSFNFPHSSRPLRNSLYPWVFLAMILLAQMCSNNYSPTFSFQDGTQTDLCPEFYFAVWSVGEYRWTYFITEDTLYILQIMFSTSPKLGLNVGQTVDGDWRQESTGLGPVTAKTSNKHTYIHIIYKPVYIFFDAHYCAFLRYKYWKLTI